MEDTWFMADLPVCPRCGKLGVGAQCAHCGAVMEAAAEEEMVLESAPSAVGPREERKAAAAYLSLEPSETAVLHAASRIFAAFISSGTVSQANENEVADRAVQLATRMALVVEKYIQSDREDW
jgi:hypothetical protein